MHPSFELDLPAVVAFCEAHGIHHKADAEANRLVIPRTDGSDYSVRILFLPERGMVTVAYPVPGEVPEGRMANFQAAANLLNARTYMGAWVLNTDTRELYFRQTVHTRGVTYTMAAVKALLEVVVGSVEDQLKPWSRMLRGAPPEAILADETELL